MQLLIETEDAASARAAVKGVEELEQLMAANADGCERIAAMLRSDMDSSKPARSVDEGIEFCERLFDWSVQQSEEASVALYSLGNPQLLERATREVVAQLELWNILSQKRVVLDIGCGIGRIAAELAPRVKAVYGIDVSGGMIDAALRRCAPLGNVQLLKGSGRDLREYPDAFFDTALAVDTLPYIHQSGGALVDSFF